LVRAPLDGFRSLGRTPSDGGEPSLGSMPRARSGEGWFVRLAIMPGDLAYVAFVAGAVEAIGV
jgi:hypothetical protein